MKRKILTVTLVAGSIFGSVAPAQPTSAIPGPGATVSPGTPNPTAPPGANPNSGANGAIEDIHVGSMGGAVDNRGSVGAGSTSPVGSATVGIGTTSPVGARVGINSRSTSKSTTSTTMKKRRY